MTNQDFINFVVRDKKVPYDDTLLNQLWTYFTIAIQDLETRIDFEYCRKTTLLTVLKDNNYINIPDNVKYIKTIYDKSNQQELFGDKDTKSFFLMFNSNEKGYPNRYYFDSVDKKLYFSCSLINNNDYILDYFIYTYDNPTLTSPTATHPLLNENFELINLTMGLLIERYYSADLNLDAKLKEYFEVNERARQERREYSKTLIRIDNPRY
jgi:hypothetical protein